MLQNADAVGKEKTDFSDNVGTEGEVETGELVEAAWRGLRDILRTIEGK